MESLYYFTDGEYTIERMADSYDEALEKVAEEVDDVSVFKLDRIERHEGATEWLSRYSLVRNPSSPEQYEGPPAGMFEPLDPKDLSVLQEAEIQKIWTLVEEDGVGWVVAGKHFVNRICHFITEQPWKKEDEQYLYW
jgi:hypothetical protein